MSGQIADKGGETTTRRQSLRDRILSAENIYNAIYSLESYVADRGMLNTAAAVRDTKGNVVAANDLELFFALGDKHNTRLIERVIRVCHKRLSDILDKPKVLFKAQVFFKIKGIDERGGHPKFRPIHSARLTDQICMASILNCLMFDDTDGTRRLSELSKLLPSCFYGNMPSSEPECIYSPWQTKYREFVDDTIEHCRQYQDSHEYQTEVRLDIKNFFPSVDPRSICNLIIDKLAHVFTDEDDISTLRRAVEKLLLIRLKSKNIEHWQTEYYGSDSSTDGKKLFLTCGIAQGLPHAPFFGNLCMTEVRKILMDEECFGGDAYFYVDDAVVFVKGKPEKLEEFKHRIDTANEKLKQWGDKWSNKRDDKWRKPEPQINALWQFHDKPQKKYKIELHPNGKSSFCNIDDTDTNLGRLAGIARETYQMGHAHRNQDETDDSISSEKLKAIIKLIEGHISKLNAESGQQNASRLKMLKRFKRFFLYRSRLLNIKVEGGVSQNDIEGFKSRLCDNDLGQWLEQFDEEIFQSEYRMLIQQGTSEMAKSVKKLVTKFEQEAIKEQDRKKKESRLYYSKDASSTLASKGLACDDYASLANWLRRTNMGAMNTHGENPLKSLKWFLTASPGTDGGLNSILRRGFDQKRFTRFAAQNSAEFQRKVLNAYFSSLVGVPASDALAFVASRSRTLRYYELRILAWLRNKSFDRRAFAAFVDTLSVDDHGCRMGIDMAVLEVLPLFIGLVKKPERVDALITTHRIVKGLWSNGSKFLNAYTLHNEEHAVTLIKAARHIVKTIDYFAIKDIDYYILFLACYLHDISMVLHPAMTLSVPTDLEGRRLASDMLKAAKSHICRHGESAKAASGEATLKEYGTFLVEVFEAVYSYFESKVRDGHAKDSSAFMKSASGGLLSYLEPTLLAFVAKVSESHGYETADVYGLKSRAQTSVVSLKYLMILIRLADLLDAASDRVNADLLQQNLGHMPLVSCFHWISHFVTDEVVLTAKYETVGEKIFEKLSVDLHLNVKSLGAYDGGNACRKCGCARTEDGFRIDVGGGGKDAEACLFLCRWMHKKHEWLIGELEELNAYLATVNNSLISTSISVDIHTRDAMPLGGQMLDKVRAYLG